LTRSVSIRIFTATLSLVALCSCASAPKVQSAGPRPAVPVSVAAAVEESVPTQLHVIGTVEPSITVQIKSQIAGELFKVDFVEGTDVKQGDLLFEIDPRPYQEALRQAKAAVSRDEAQQHLAEANLARDLAQSKFAEADAARNEQLLKDRVVSRSQNEQSRATYDALKESIRADRAAIESARATLESDQAAVEAANLNLRYCEIRSPVSGRAGNVLIHNGNLVKVNDTALVVINQLTPIFVSFSVPQEHLGAVRTSSSARKLPVHVSFQDDPAKTAEGVLTVIDNSVDTNTGTIKLKATFSNEQHLLWPGQFVNVSLTLGAQNMTVVPSEAVQAGQRGPFIYVVKQDQTVETRDVTVGTTIGRKAVVLKGVAPGDTVVTDGQLRLYPGARIQAVPASKIDSQTL
jgi:multidrug efflux system membrane fusion protein